MHLVVINSWKTDAGDLTQEIAQAFGITAYEVKQRIRCGSPTVLASFADPQQALAVVNKLNPLGIASMVVDAMEVRSRTGTITVRHFKGPARNNLDSSSRTISPSSTGRVTCILTESL